jgi:TolB-like protein
LKNVKEPIRIYEVTIQQTLSEDVVSKESKKKLSEKSIAVLPFVDMSPALDQEYLGDGLQKSLSIFYHK